MCVHVSYHVLDAAQNGRGQDGDEEGHQVQAGERPDEDVQSENLLAASHAHKLKVVGEVASAARQRAIGRVGTGFKLIR